MSVLCRLYYNGESIPEEAIVNWEVRQVDLMRAGSLPVGHLVLLEDDNGEH